jgi:N-acyl-D-amino-acid deacylase
VGTLGLTGRRITYLGRETGLATRRTLSADGLVVAPGFIDPHTHYDAQVAWDPLLTSSPWHGVTTVVTGNCGVGVAPVKPAMRDVLLHDLVNVEAIPYEVMHDGIEWQWESYGEYLAAMDRRGLGIKVAALVPLTPLRHYVLGEASFERPAISEETATMRALLREPMHAGAFGLSATTSQNHTGYAARALACCNASQAVPAALFGIPDRGTLAEGSVADLVLFDRRTVAAKPPEYVRDFPRQGRRLISKTEGVVATFVAGTQVYDQGTHTGAFPGRVLRSHA